MKFAPFKPCTLLKHVRVEILHREFPVKNLYFPCKGLQCTNVFTMPTETRKLYQNERQRTQSDTH